MAKQRVDRLDAEIACKVRLIEADATEFRPAHGVDCVYFSYALTMIPDWRRAIDNAIDMLVPGGSLAVVDFHLPHDAWLSNGFWRRWFAHDGVWLSGAHLPYLRHRLDTAYCAQRYGGPHIFQVSSCPITCLSVARAWPLRMRRVAMTEVRSIFLSDIHLGTRACQSQRLLEFLKEYESEYLFLIGDIIDFWAMARRGVYWSADMNTVVQKVLKRARHGCKVIFVPGNHDEALRE